MKLPSLSDLLPEQRKIFLSDPEDSILVVGPPGSGKTSTALWKARTLAGPEYAKSVVVITRNRLLAALAAQISEDHGGNAVESATMAKFVATAYWKKFGRMVPQHVPYDFIWERVIADYEAARGQPLVDHLIIDEGQNLPLDFIVWAKRFIARNVSVFMDEAQATDGGGCQVAELVAAGFDEVLPLTVNHRNTQEIANLVEHFHLHRTIPHLRARRGPSGEIPQLRAFADWASLARAIAIRFNNRGDSIGVIVYEKQDVELMERLVRELLPSSVRVNHYTSTLPPHSEDAIRMREPGVTIISGESATGLEFDSVFLQDLGRSLPRVEEIDNRRLYMLCARARDSLVLVNGPVALNEAQLDSLPRPPTLQR